MTPYRFTALLFAVAFAAGFSGCRTTPQAKEAKFLERGKALAAKKEYSKAIIEFRNAAAAMPKDAEPPYRMGLAYLETGDAISAVRAFHKATELNPKHAGAQLKLAEMMTVSRYPKYIQEAITRLQGAFGDSPEDPEAIDTLAVAEWKLGKPGDAVQRLQEALKRFPTHLQSSISLAQMKIAAKDWEGAGRVLKQAVADAPQSAPAEVALGEFYNLRGQPAQAEAEIRKALQLDPKNGPALAGLGVILTAARRTDEAEQVYRRLSTLPEKAYKPMHAIFLYQSGKYDPAIREFESLAKSDPDDRAARSRLVAAYYDRNRISDAEKILADALKRNPRDADALLQRAEIRLRSGKGEDAERDLKEVLHFTPDSANAHFALARAYRLRGLALEQQQELQQALKLNPSLLQARFALELSYLSARQGKAALDIMDSAPEPQKKLLAWLLRRNWALLALGNLQEAKAGIDRALQADRPAEAIYQEGIFRYMQRDNPGVRADMEDLLKREPTNIRAAELLMDAYAAQGQLANGLERLRQMALAHPDSAPLQELLGMVSFRAGRSGAAQQAFERAKAIDPHYEAADLSLAEMDIKGGRSDAALQRLRLVVSADPKSVPALLLSASAGEASGDQATAVASYRAVLNVDRSNLIALNNLAYDLAMENPDEALKLAQQAAELAPDSPNVADTLGWIYYRKGLYTMSVEYLKAAVAKESTPRRQFHLGMSYLRVGDRITGQKIVREALQKDPNLAKTEQGW